MPNFEIRSLSPNDEPFLWDVLYEAIYVPPGEPPPPRSVVHEPEMAHYVAGWGGAPSGPGDLGVIAIDPATQQPAGAAWVRLLQGDNCGYGYVDDATPELTTAVLPAYRGQGAGTQLLAELLRMAAAHYAAVSLSVWKVNPARRLYERLGFVTVKEDTNTLTMRCQLRKAKNSPPQPEA
jgi:ribosomal protein S18 acetylase RimI-like enzyme